MVGWSGCSGLWDGEAMMGERSWGGVGGFLLSPSAVVVQYMASLRAKPGNDTDVICDKELAGTKSALCLFDINHLIMQPITPQPK